MTFIVPEHKRKVQVGDRFGRLTVAGVPFLATNGKQRVQAAVFYCDCGVFHLAIVTKVRGGAIRSCGCLIGDAAREANTKHGGDGSVLYSRWHGMKVRCLMKSSADWDWYGGRGIAVCREWVDDFGAFRSWAMSSGFDPRLQLDRIDGNGPYSPANCRWVSCTDNINNRSNTVLLTAFGESKTLSDWIRDERCLVSRPTIYSRLNLGWCHEDAISKPPRKVSRAIPVPLNPG